MKVLIIGVNGFIGRHLHEHLTKNSTYTLLTPDSKTLNISDESSVDNYLHVMQPDIIINCANRGGGRDTIDMKSVTEYNLRIFFNIVKHEKEVKKIISFGSGAEYGKHKPIVDAKEDDYLATLPLDEYGFYKAITSHYIEKTDRIVQLRIFGAYGEYENYRYKFISNAIVKNLLHLPITINKNVFFDYIYVDDLVRMIDWFIHNDAKEKVYNVSTGKRIDLIALSNIINEVSDFKSEIRLLHEGLNNEYTSNNERILSEMGDFEFTSHKNAITKMRDYFKYNLDKLDSEVIKEDPYLKVIDTIWKE